MLSTFSHGTSWSIIYSKNFISSGFTNLKHRCLKSYVGVQIYILNSTTCSLIAVFRNRKHFSRECTLAFKWCVESMQYGGKCETYSFTKEYCLWFSLLHYRWHRLWSPSSDLWYCRELTSLSLWRGKVAVMFNKAFCAPLSLFGLSSVKQNMTAVKPGFWSFSHVCELFWFILL